MASVAEFIRERLENHGVRHLMCVPGDYILPFLGTMSQSKKIKIINNTDEAAAGFAADGYARMFGIGCLAVTYNVGALKVCNPVACAYAERSPVVVIGGSPGLKERNDQFLPHHCAGSFDSQREIFKNITCAQAILDNPTTAGYEVDRVFQALKYHKQPVYIELLRDVGLQPVQYDVYTQGTPQGPGTDMHNLEDALREVVAWIEESKNPVILAGVELARFDLGKDLIRFAERHNIPVACTLLSKSVINEMHPLYVGTYAGSNSSQRHVREMVEDSDCLLVFGEQMTEATVGYRPCKAFSKREMVTCTVNTLRVKNHTYPKVLFTDFCRAMFRMELSKRSAPCLPPKHEVGKFCPAPAAKLTTVRLFEKINSILHENIVVVADTGDSLLGASDLITCHAADTFYGPAYYLSMGFAIPAALGMQLAVPTTRPLVIVGDGAFQMSSSELSTMLKHKLNPIIFVLNNGGYTTERLIMDGPFNDINNWNYHEITKLIGGGQGRKVETEEALEAAVADALKSDTLFVINCVVDPKDVSPALKRMTEAMAKKVTNERTI